MTLEAILDEIRDLPISERKRLISLIVETLTEDASQPRKTHSITELRGLGKELWQGIDPQQYVDDLRKEWDDRL